MDISFRGQNGQRELDTQTGRTIPCTGEDNTLAVRSAMNLVNSRFSILYIGMRFEHTFHPYPRRLSKLFSHSPLIVSAYYTPC